MVLRKPYAFLIKHFRMIHLLLLIPMFYLIIHTRAITQFFALYVSSGQSLNIVTINSSLSSNFINIFMYFAVVIIMVVLIFISLLLQNKEKPTKLYNITIFYYLGIFVLISLCFSVFNRIEADLISTVAIRIIRDLAYVVHYSQYLFVAFIIIRGIGFDIKKFDFQSDLTTLDISQEDDEEFEFLVGTDIYKAKRSIRRFIREMGYYYKENRFIFNVIIGVVAIIFLTVIYMNREVYDKVYKENEYLSFGNVNVKILDSYVSNLSYDGKEIKDGKTYLILQVAIQNRYREDKEFNYSGFQLHVNRKYYSPDLSMANYFIDFGETYGGGYIKGNTEASYVLAYELDKSLANKSFNIVVYSRYDTSPGGLGAVLKTIEIKPTVINDKVTSNIINKGTNVNLKSTQLKSSTGTIMDYQLIDRYQYNYQYCTGGDNCYSSVNSISVSGREVGRYTLLVMDYDLELDSNSTYVNANRTYKSFFEDFMKIKYKVNNKEYMTDVKLVNPANFNEKLVTKVPYDIYKASDIEAVITVRNVAYRIKLK